MRPMVRRSGIAAGGAGLLVLLGSAGYATARQRRLARLYRRVRVALAQATGDYAGSLRTIANLSLDVDPGNVRTVVVNRPHIDVPNDAELRCMVSANVETDNLGRLVIAIDGPREVVAYLRKRLEADRTITAEFPPPTHEGNDMTAKVYVRVFAHTDPVVTEARRLLNPSQSTAN